ncbi:MAG: hypothetical protein EXR31_02570 [Betaproteobacteria bacterium]|nr:hypothetical protein [Betaproteobacteria bacterium]
MDARLMMDRMGAGFAATLLASDRASAAEERLPFTVRAVTGETQLHKAVSIRHRTYGRHVPGLAETLRAPEANDYAPGCIVLLAESKLDGEPLGTLRIQTNRFRPLALESSVELPDVFAGRSLAEATRLGVSEARVGRVVKVMLFKALYQYCVETGIEWMVIGARAPLDRMYQSLLFSDVFPGEAPVPLKHASNLPHRILGFEIDTADERWRAARHPMYDLFVNTRHPDIDISDAVPSYASPARHMEMPAALAA